MSKKPFVQALRMTGMFSILVLSMLFFVAAFHSTASAQDGVGVAATESEWRAVYYNNTTLSGQPAFFRDEAVLDHNWGYGSPDPSVNSDSFSARWTRIVDVPAGTYRFSITGDDGVRVFVNDELILNGWWEHSARTFTVERTLLAGQHEVRVEFFEQTGVALVTFSLEQVSGDSPAPTPTPTPDEPDPPPSFPPQPGTADPSWQGQYYANANLEGRPVLERNETAINFNWGNGSPAANVPADRFSARWTRTLFFSEGVWRFQTTTDDGVRLFIDGELVIDQWHVQSATSHEANVPLQEGLHTVRMEYFERTGGALARLDWDTTGAETTGKGNLITCVPPNPPNYAWIRVYRKNPSTGEWYRAIPQGVGSIHASGFLKIDGLPVDVARYGGEGEPYWIEQWIDGRVARSVGNTDRGEPEFRIRADADNYTPWQCNQ